MAALLLAPKYASNRIHGPTAQSRPMRVTGQASGADSIRHSKCCPFVICILTERANRFGRVFARDRKHGIRNQMDEQCAHT